MFAIASNITSPRVEKGILQKKLKYIIKKNLIIWS